MTLPEAIAYIKNDLALPKFHVQMNYHHVTYFIGANINNLLSISCNVLSHAYSLTHTHKASLMCVYLCTWAAHMRMEWIY